MSELPADVASAIARADDTGRPPRELNVAKTPVADSLRDLPRDASYLAISGRAGDLSCLPEFRALQVLWIAHVNDAILSLVGKCATLQVLIVHAASVETLSSLRGLALLRHLVVHDARKLTTVIGIETLATLRTLLLWDLQRFTDLSSLGALTELHGLQFGGGMWTTLKPRSLTPLATLSQLRYLEMPATKAQDGSLAALSALRQLRELFLPNAYPVEQFAALAASLPNTRGDCLRAHWRGTLPCEQCATPKLLETGRGGRLVCPNCDPQRVARRAAQFKELVSRGSAARWRGTPVT